MNSQRKNADEDAIVFRPIGMIRSPFEKLEDMPIQPVGEASASGRVELFPEFAEGLRDLDGFSHLILIYHFHKVTKSILTVIPFLDSSPRGVFSTRAPTRPNAVGLSVVALEKVEGTTLFVTDLDVLDGTPLLDIKPYVPKFDHRPEVRVGWLEGVYRDVGNQRSDDRFM
jgi:tRNA-Thr(GGU) m(6)t(6)A37 methyltransferase TsaA